MGFVALTLLEFLLGAREQWETSYSEKGTERCLEKGLAPDQASQSVSD